MSHSRVASEHFVKLALSNSYRSYTKVAVKGVTFNTASLPVKASENSLGIPSVRSSSMDTEFKEAGIASERLQSCHPFSAHTFNYHAEVMHVQVKTIAKMLL